MVRAHRIVYIHQRTLCLRIILLVSFGPLIFFIHHEAAFCSGKFKIGKCFLYSVAQLRSGHICTLLTQEKQVSFALYIRSYNCRANQKLSFARIVSTVGCTLIFILFKQLKQQSALPFGIAAYQIV